MTVLFKIVVYLSKSNFAIKLTKLSKHFVSVMIPQIPTKEIRNIKLPTPNKTIEIKPSCCLVRSGANEKTMS